MNCNVPIIVQRQRSKHNHHVFSYPITNNTPQLVFMEEEGEKKKTFRTLEQKKQNVRIRRIQSSGGKRKLPKDFFRRENSQPQKIKINESNKHINHNDERISRTAEQVGKHDENSMETPKFKNKFKDSENDKNCYIPLNFKERINQQQDNKGLWWENTFSNNGFFNGGGDTFVGKKLTKIEKQNNPKKKKKTPRELKKFSIMKDRTGYFRFRNIFQ